MLLVLFLMNNLNVVLAVWWFIVFWNQHYFTWRRK